MTANHHRTDPAIAAPFGAATTAAQVLQGMDLAGTTALVTGGHSGLGLESTRALAGAGAHVIVAARDAGQARAALAGLPRVEVQTLDLGDLASVRACAGRLLAAGRPIGMLIASAGIMACPETRVGPGWEAQFATNHLGHYALANLLWPLLRQHPGGARVVSVSSAGHRLSGMRWDDVHFTAHGYDKWQAYGQSKTANALFALHLDRLGQADGVRAFSLHPGKIFTPLQRHLGQQEMIEAGWLCADGTPADPSFKTPEQGAATQVWAATSPTLAGQGGLYCEDCRTAPEAVSPHAADAGEAERLWALSARLTSIDAFAMN